jgi:hypothetical protein
MDDVNKETEKRLAAAADAFQKAPKELRAAIIDAGREGATNIEIAQAIRFAYNPDYVGKLISAELGPRKPGRRPS